MLMKEKRRLTPFVAMLFLLCCSSYGLYARAQSSLNDKISLKMENASLPEVLRQVEAKSGFTFLYKNELLAKSNKVNINAVDKEIAQVLTEILKPSGLSYEVDDNVIIIKAESQQPAAQQQKITVKGKVINEATGEPIVGATIVLKATPSVGTVSNAAGEFTLQVPRVDEPLSISYIGMTTIDYAFAKSYQQNAVITIKMTPDQIKVEEVIVMGSVERKKESFTGANKVVSADQLKSIGNQNIVQSLKSLDPSFTMVNNAATNLSGSNPNVLPTIEMRGQTSISTETVQNIFDVNPNQPLFIMDGFETTLQAIIDLPMERIASIALLKDAASTAMYGSRAANGVVVVTTVRPEAGKLRFTYTADLTFEYPDLGSYNMMNAAENLEYERRAGRYTFYSSSYTNPANPNDHRLTAEDFRAQLRLDSLYSMRLAEVKRGVNSYWLSDPLRNAFTNRNTIRISGGADDLRVDASLSFKNQPGVMKGSKRNTWGGNVDLMYTFKDFTFYNKLSLSGYDASESPWGRFDTWVNTNPYYRKYNEDGSIPRYLERDVTNGNSSSTKYNVPNPLYNALRAGGYDDSKNLSVTNNFQVNWNFHPEMYLQGALSLTKTKANQYTFLPPENTFFDNVDVLEKGTYTQSDRDYFTYNANLMWVWNKAIDKHRFTANVRGEIQQIKQEYFLTEAAGFPAGTDGNPSFIFHYKTDAKPAYSFSLTRRVNFLATGNYAYDNRYLCDVTFRVDGSTVFGSAKKYSPFWAVGFGWNAHNETFLKDIEWIDMLRVRGNVGTSGNQNISATFSSTSTYGYMEDRFNYFATGVVINSLGNPNIEWQNTMQTSLGVDFSMAQDRFRLELNFYNKNTDPLIVAVDEAPSKGVATYSMNLGHMITKGFEFDFNYNIINNREQRIQWGVRGTGSVVRTKFKGLKDQLGEMNNFLLNNQSVVRYMDGYSQDDIWAVRSLGIDPATGKELFQTKEGTATFLYNPNDYVRVGNTRPDITGIIGTNVRYKQLYMTLNLRYSIGADVFNTALYNKVENISMADVTKNHDRRALYSRWFQPGDISEFKGISLTTSTPMSSRFVQKNNYFSGESISVGYEFDKQGWIHYLRLASLRVQAYMNDFFLASTVKAERGIYYPFTRSVSMSITATF